MRRAFDDVRDRLAGGARMLVHCSAGNHRTGMIGYALLRHLGLTADSAVATLRALRAVTADGVGEHRLAWGDRFGRPEV